MEQKFSLEKRPEGTVKPTGKSGKSGPRRWEIEQYIFEEPTDNQRPLHGDPRDKHDNDFSDDDGDPGYGHPGVGIGPVPDFSASASSAGDQGTLAGGSCFSTTEQQQQRREKQQAKAKWSRMQKEANKLKEVTERSNRNKGKR
jgi:hypothetical protein